MLRKGAQKYAVTASRAEFCLQHDTPATDPSGFAALLSKALWVHGLRIEFRSSSGS